MNVTNLMRADEIANGFNTTGDCKYWRAAVAGSRVNPEVHFNSRASMVQISYRITTGEFTVTFARANAAFGDFLASVHRSMSQVLTGLKAAGLPFTAPLDDNGVLRIEYDPRNKAAVVHMARQGDDWPDAEPVPFKVPAREISAETLSALDAPEYDA